MQFNLVKWNFMRLKKLLSLTSISLTEKYVRYNSVYCTLSQHH